VIDKTRSSEYSYL